MRAALRTRAAGAVGVVLCVLLGLLVARPELSAAERAELASRYGFSTVALNPGPAPDRTTRTVAPALQDIDGWISAVGAAAGLADLRGSGRPADVCLVDPRDDSVTLRAVPDSDTPDYPSVRLDPAPLPMDATMAPMGCVPADIDADGGTDLVVSYWGRSPVVFLATGPGDAAAPGTFRPAELVEPMQVWNSSGINVGDIDGDGYLDLLVANYFPDDARILDPTSHDPRIQMQDSMSLAHNGGTNRLLLGGPTEPDTVPPWQDATSALPADAATSWTLAAGFQDLTGDLRPDIYLANDFGPDHLLVNTSTPGRVVLDAVVGDRDVGTPKSQVLGRDSFKGMGVAFSWAAGAELPHIAVSNITSPYALHESNFLFAPAGRPEDLLAGGVPFADRSEAAGLARSGWSWDLKAADFDNDGVDELVQATGFLKGTVDRWPLLQELAMGNDDLLRRPGAWPKFREGDDLSGHEHNPFWAAGPDGRYTDLAADLGVDGTEVTRGLAVGDVNGDGALDVVVANQWEGSTVMLNTGATGPSAGLRLERELPGGGSTPAIGAQLRLETPGGTRIAQLYPANGHAGVSAAEIHVGLPDGPAPATVSWRDATGVHESPVTVAPGRSTLILRADGTAVRR